MAIRRIGQIFVDMGFIDDDQLEMLVEEQQQQPGEKIGKIAEEMGLITDDQLAQALAEQMNLQVVDLSEANIGAPNYCNTRGSCTCYNIYDCSG